MWENVVNRLEKLIETEAKVLDALDAEEKINPRWKAIARTHFEQGFMAWQRAIKEASDEK